MNEPTIKSLGETIRELRMKRKMPLRELASMLEIDLSTLSKIERNERRVNQTTLDRISSIFKIEKSFLTISYLSDKLASELLNELDHKTILMFTERKIEFLQTRIKESTNA